MFTLFGFQPNVSPKVAFLVAGGLGLLGLGYLGSKVGPVKDSTPDIVPQIVVKGVAPAESHSFDLLEVHVLGALTSYSTLARPEPAGAQGLALRCRRCDRSSPVRSALPSQGALLVDFSGVGDWHEGECPIR